MPAAVLYGPQIRTTQNKTMNKPISECKILVTPTSFGKDDPSLMRLLEQEVGRVIYNLYGRPLKSNELPDLIQDCDGYIAAG
jgi:hypothetical protein